MFNRLHKLCENQNYFKDKIIKLYFAEDQNKWIEINCNSPAKLQHAPTPNEEGLLDGAYLSK
jgi:hypothetical protein